jgi:hypothetical protein
MLFPSPTENRLVNHWMSEMQADIMDELYELTKQAETSRKELTNDYDE